MNAVFFVISKHKTAVFQWFRIDLMVDLMILAVQNLSVMLLLDIAGIGYNIM